jgi:cation-transporting P-type ATPase 13A2
MRVCLYVCMCLCVAHSLCVYALGRAAGVEMSSADVVPGDFVRLPAEDAHAAVPCDCVLVRGACLVNEAMLTGESVPTTKTAVVLEALPQTDSSSSSGNSGAAQRVPEAAKDAARHMLYTGTRILLARHEGTEPPTAVVVHTGPCARPISLPYTRRLPQQIESPPACACEAGRCRSMPTYTWPNSPSPRRCFVRVCSYVCMYVRVSGFNTTKGQLIRSILYPRPSPFSFHRDSLRFVAVMGGVGACQAVPYTHTRPGKQQLGD